MKNLEQKIQKEVESQENKRRDAEQKQKEQDVKDAESAKELNDMNNVLYGENRKKSENLTNEIADFYLEEANNDEER